MDAEYAYTKKRMHFGKRCNFSDFDKIEVEIKSNPSLMSNYVRMDPVTHATQCSKVYAVHEVQIFFKQHLVKSEFILDSVCTCSGKYNYCNI